MQGLIVYLSHYMIWLPATLFEASDIIHRNYAVVNNKSGINVREN
jgi:hypothetical protein